MLKILVFLIHKTSFFLKSTPYCPKQASSCHPPLAASCLLFLQLTVSTKSIACLQMSMDHFQALVLWHHHADWFRQCNWISKCLIHCHAQLIQCSEKRPQQKDECGGIEVSISLPLSLCFFFFFYFSSHKRKTGVGFCPLSHFLANRNKSPGLCNSVVKEERLLWESPRAFDGRERIKSYVFN